MTKDDRIAILGHFNGIQMAIHRYCRTNCPLEDILKVIQNHIDYLAGLDGKDRAAKPAATQEALL